MKKKLFLSRLLKITAFGLILALLLSYTYKVFSWKDGVGDYSSSTETLYNDLDANIVDVLFVGSSHCYSSIRNTQLWDDYGMGVFSMVVSGQDIASSYYHMNEVFKTQSPALVCVELYGITFDEHAITANIYRNTLPLKYSENFLGVVDAIAPEEDKTDYLLKWPILHTRYRELKRQDFVNNAPAYLGSYAFDSIITDLGEITIYDGTETEPVSDEKLMYVQKMVDLAKENDAEICFFIVPYKTSETKQKQFKYMEAYLTEQGIPVVNLFDKYDEIGIDSHTDYYDSGHTNRYGATKITTYMGEYLKNNYNIPDRRTDERYYLWQENSVAFQHMIANEKLAETENIFEYIEQLKIMDGYTVVIASTGEHMSDTVDISSELFSFGIDKDFIKNGGAVVIDNSTVVFDDYTNEFLYYTDTTLDPISVKNDDGKTQITVGKVLYNTIDNGIHILVYDNILGTIADFVGFNSHHEYNSNRL